MSSSSNNIKKLFNLINLDFLFSCNLLDNIEIDLLNSKKFNHELYLNSENFFIDKALKNFCSLDINCKNYDYKFLDEKIEYVSNNSYKFNLNTAYVKLGEIKNILKSKIYKNSQNNIDLVVRAFWNKSLVIFIPPNTYLKEPIDLGEKIQEQLVVIKNIIIIVGQNSYVEFFEEISSINICYIQSAIIILKSNSKVKFIKKNENVNGYSLSSFNCYLYKDSSLKFVDYNFNSKLYLNNFNFILKDKSAEVFYDNSANMEHENNQIIFTEQLHESSYTKSKVNIKTTLSSYANSFYKGLIKIDKIANNSDASQKHLALILSDINNNIKNISIPALEINNNDIKCIHGSAMEKIDKNQLEYLRSRGLTKDKAKKNIIEGFFKEDNLNIHKNYLDDLVNKII